jgi:tetratricopeptide (TPR) repeat protein
MDPNKGWELFKAGQVQQALEQFRKDYAEKPWQQTLANLGLGYLYAGQLDRAMEFLDGWAQWRRPRMHGAYLWTGVVRWLLNEPVDACTVWVAGLDCSYQDPAGGLELPLVLHFAAVDHPEAGEPKGALDLIHQRLASACAKHWPGPIGKFVVGSLTEQELNEITSNDPHQPRRMQRLAQVQFYAGVLALSDKQRPAFYERMGKCITIPESQYSHEAMLAKHELKSR